MYYLCVYLFIHPIIHSCVHLCMYICMYVPISLFIFTSMYTDCNWNNHIQNAEELLSHKREFICLFLKHKYKLQWKHQSHSECRGNFTSQIWTHSVVLIITPHSFIATKWSLVQCCTVQHSTVKIIPLSSPQNNTCGLICSTTMKTSNILVFCIQASAQAPMN